jgi:hypothetical protein
MLTDRAEGWKKNNDANQGGAKTRHEVAKEVEEKYETARQAQDDERRQGYNNNRQGGGNYGRRDTNNNDRDNRDNRRGGNQDRQQQYVKKTTDRDGRGRREGDADGQKGGKVWNTNEKGGRNDRNRNKNEERTKKDIIEITEEEMTEVVKKGFKSFISFHKEPEDEAVEEGEDKPKQKEEFDYSIFFKLRDVNGQSPANILCALYTNAQDESEEQAKKYLSKILEYFV